MIHRYTDNVECNLIYLLVSILDMEIEYIPIAIAISTIQLNTIAYVNSNIAMYP